MPTKVLIADNDPISANWLKSVLEAAGCAVDTLRQLQARVHPKAS
jgi:DNA-binding response OmpR family regulator